MFCYDFDLFSLFSWGTTTEFPAQFPAQFPVIFAPVSAPCIFSYKSCKGNLLLKRLLSLLLFTWIWPGLLAAYHIIVCGASMVFKFCCWWTERVWSLLLHMMRCRCWKFTALKIACRSLKHNRIGIKNKIIGLLSCPWFGICGTSSIFQIFLWSTVAFVLQLTWLLSTFCNRYSAARVL